MADSRDAFVGKRVLVKSGSGDGTTIVSDVEKVTVDVDGKPVDRLRGHTGGGFLHVFDVKDIVS